MTPLTYPTTKSCCPISTGYPVLLCNHVPLPWLSSLGPTTSVFSGQMIFTKKIKITEHKYLHLCYSFYTSMLIFFPPASEEMSLIPSLPRLPSWRKTGVIAVGSDNLIAPTQVFFLSQFNFLV